MASATLTYHPKDQTITIKVDNHVEHISTEFKTKAQIFDAVKYACISKGAIISDIELTAVLQLVYEDLDG